MTYEYHIHTTDLSRPGATEDATKALNDLGVEGWRLASTEVVASQRGSRIAGDMQTFPVMVLVMERERK